MIGYIALAGLFGFIAVTGGLLILGALYASIFVVEWIAGVRGS